MAGTEVAVPEHHMLVPWTGELVDTRDEAACVMALDGLREHEQLIREAKRALTDAVVERSRVLGTKTLALPGGLKAEIRGGPVTVYDPEQIEEGLRALGMPEDRIREIVVETVSYQVSAAQAKRARGANPEYAQVIDQHTRTEERALYVGLKR